MVEDNHLIDMDDFEVQQVAYFNGLLAAEQYMNEVNNGYIQTLDLTEAIADLVHREDIFFAPLVSLSNRTDH